MTYKKFQDLIERLKEREKTISDLYKRNVDLIEFVDPYHVLINSLIEEVYGEEGADWIHWYCYENDFGKKGLEAYDKDKSPICYDVKSLWKWVEKLREGR